MRDHSPIVIREFNGFYSRGDADSCPPDHFTACNNIQFVMNGFRWRDGIGPYLAYPVIKRIYTFNQETGQSVLILNDQYQIFDSGSPTPLVPILTVVGMNDFGFVPIAGRAYLTPSDGTMGLQNEFVYVYEGNGTPARKAAGSKPTNAEGLLAAANSATAGHVEQGVHVFGAVYETTSGFLTSIGPATKPTVTAPGGKQVDLTAIPVSASSVVTKVHIVATKAINPALYTNDTEGYEFFFVPGAIVNNGVTTLSVSFFDSELLESADNLFDLFEEIPAAVGLTTYHNRMVTYTEWSDTTLGSSSYGNISIARISDVGQPEAINQVDGLITFPLDGNPITNAQEFRDVLYLFKQTRTNAWTDNGDVPSSWPMTLLDQGIGCSLHGLATVLDSGGVNADYLILADYSGIMLFNGTYQRPELTWKIATAWQAIDQSLFNAIQVINDSLKQRLYMTLPGGTMLLADYSNGLTPKDVRFSTWTFDAYIRSLTLINTNTLLLASDGAA